MARNKKETVSFIATIPANTAKTLFYVINSPATIERISGKFYPGQEGDLQVRPYLQMTGERSEELITYPSGANAFISGDDKVIDVPIDFDVSIGDQIKVYANNISAFDYTLDIAFTVDYVGGKGRVI